MQCQIATIVSPFSLSFSPSSFSCFDKLNDILYLTVPKGKGMFNCLFPNLLPDCHHHWLATHWKTFLFFSFFEIHYPVPGKHFDRLVGGSRPFFRSKGTCHCCILFFFRLSSSLAATHFKNIPFSFVLYSFILCQAKFWLFCRRHWTLFEIERCVWSLLHSEFFASLSLPSLSNSLETFLFPFFLYSFILC